MNYVFQLLIRITVLTFIAKYTFAESEVPTAYVVAEHWPPWEVALDHERQSVTSGWALDITNELARRLDIQIEVIVMPWKRAVRMIKTGRADIIPMIVETSGREEHMFFTLPVYEDKLLFVYSTDKFDEFKWESWDDIQPYTIGITLGTKYVTEVTDKHNLRVETATNDMMNITKLLRGRVDLSPMYYLNAASMFKEVQDHEKLRFAQKPIATRPFRFAISKQSFLAERIEEINRIFEEMHNDGTFKNIIGEFYIEQPLAH